MKRRYDIEYTDEFEGFWDGLPPAWQVEVAAVVGVLGEYGPAIPPQYSEPIKSSAYSNMKELKIQCQGHPVRVFYAFDPRRTGILLLGGDKTGDGRFYKKNVPLADKIYGQHLLEIGEG